MPRPAGKLQGLAGMYGPDRFKAPVGVMGWLTPLGPCAGDRSMYKWRCSCGTELVRQAKGVRRAVKLGGTPACEACARILRSEALMRKEA